jgi:hypothetical protein
MRLKSLIRASFTILAFLAVIAQAVNWENPDSQSVDDMLSSGEIPVYSDRVPALTPQQAREQYQLASLQQTQLTQTQASAVSSAESTPSVKGAWSLQLLGQSPAEARITLFQSGNVIFGRGTVTQGETPLDAAASGSVKGGQISLDITTLESTTLYRTTLTLSGESASGSYQAFSATGDAWTGDANGSWVPSS